MSSLRITFEGLGRVGGTPAKWWGTPFFITQSRGGGARGVCVSVS